MHLVQVHFFGGVRCNARGPTHESCNNHGSPNLLPRIHTIRQSNKKCTGPLLRLGGRCVVPFQNLGENSGCIVCPGLFFRRVVDDVRHEVLRGRAIRDDLYIAITPQCI